MIVINAVALDARAFDFSAPVPLRQGVYDHEDTHIALLPDGRLVSFGNACMTRALLHVVVDGRDTWTHVPIEALDIRMPPPELSREEWHTVHLAANYGFPVRRAA